MNYAFHVYTSNIHSTFILIPFKLKGMYDRSNSFPFDYKTNGSPFGSQSKGKQSLRSYHIQFESNHKPISLSIFSGFLFNKNKESLSVCITLHKFVKVCLIILSMYTQALITNNCIYCWRFFFPAKTKKVWLHTNFSGILR